MRMHEGMNLEEDIAPYFEAETTIGPIKFHKWLSESWTSPLCTTELGEVARRADDFAQRNVKVIGISANNLDDHKKWIQDSNAFGGKVEPTDVQLPIIANADRKDATNKDLKGLPFTIRTVFVIDPKKVIRVTLSYPAVAGRNFGEKHRVATPVNWKQGEDVIIHASLNAEEAKTQFPDHTVHLPYLCITPL
ncbi:peroxidase [Mycena capillaripes]|nr:peroxidase [Mycena capillaripes]